jgi:hypothetical protein
MKVWRDSATEDGESEKCIISFSPKSGERTLWWQHKISGMERDHIYAARKHSELIKIINMMAIWNCL